MKLHSCGHLLSSISTAKHLLSSTGMEGFGAVMLLCSMDASELPCEDVSSLAASETEKHNHVLQKVKEGRIVVFHVHAFTCAAGHQLLSAADFVTSALASKRTTLPSYHSGSWFEQWKCRTPTACQAML